MQHQDTAMNNKNAPTVQGIITGKSVSTIALYVAINARKPTHISRTQIRN